MTAAPRSPSDLDELIPETAERSEGSISGVRPIREEILQNLDHPLCLREIFVRPQASTAPAADIAIDVEEFRVEFPHETQFFAGLSGDVACGGLFVATYRVLPLGTAVRVRFELPDGVRVEAWGEVRWIREQDAAGARRGLAIAFTDIAVEALRHASGFCLARPPLFLDF
jgi:uncharacterized protein (TIGR02266 family)